MKPVRLDIPQPPDHKLTLVRIPTTGALYLYQYERVPPAERNGLVVTADGWSLVSAVKVRPQDTAALVGFIARTAPQDDSDPYDLSQWEHHVPQYSRRG